MKKPIIGITMGDPASIGPEISVMALTDPKVLALCDPLIVGDAAVMEDAVKVVCPGRVQVRAVQKVNEAVFEPGVINVLDLGLVDMDKLVYGQVSAMCGEAAFRYVEKVIRLAMDGEIDATVTNALNKAAINLAGHHFAGHTEIYAHYTNTKNYTMMLAHENLRVVHISTHVSLREACDRVKKQRVLDCIHMANDTLKMLGIENPKIAVAGLNPHCGENGMFGTEEIEEIRKEPEMADWAQLDEFYKEGHRSQIRYLGEKLMDYDNNIGLRPIVPGATDSVQELYGPLLEEMSEWEHERWMQDKLADGWRYGRNLDPELKLTPDMVPYDELEPRVQEFIRRSVRNVPEYLEAIGYELYRKSF